MFRVRYPHLPWSGHFQLADSLFHSKIGSPGMDIHLLWLFKKKKKRFTSKFKNAVMKAQASCQRMIVYVCAAGRSCAVLCNIWPLIPGCCPVSSWMPRELLVASLGTRWLFGVLIWFVNTLSAGTSDKAQLASDLVILFIVPRKCSLNGPLRNRFQACNRILDIPNDLCELL